ncbi:MAG: HAMP domain-containing protein, partial [Anaerolineales bacterium]|nr:HAMP domain-containing protein [Anaerolineales bacterium]
DYSFTPGSDYSEWDTVRTVLAEGADEIGDKYADVVQTEWGWVFYTVGPVKLEGQTKGVLLVGTYLDSVASRLDAAALARISIYVGAGTPAATTLSPEEPEILLISESEYQSILARQEAEEIPRREIDVVGRGYSAVAGAFEARHGADLGVLTVALPSSFVTDAWQPTRQSLVVLFGVATALVLLVGSMVASAIVQRVRSLAAATQRVAAGDLRVNLEPKGYDELAALSQDFNDMVVQLREGRTYRDLLGLAASPEVADRLRKSFREGRLSMEAQLTTATVLFADIRGFTRFAESRDPAYVMRFLNDYLQGLVQIIRQYDGVINRFFGDAAMAFFGVLPESQPAEVGAKNAVLASLAILEYLRAFNEQLEARGEEHLRVGFGVSTGAVVAGAIGSEERLDYTLLGDTVNVAFRLSSMNKEYPTWDLFVSSETYQLLDGEPSIEATPLPNMRIQGRMAPIDIYAIRE